MSLPFEERLEKLNEAQRLAVETIEGPVMVVAGPGSGKTELLSLRVANILNKTDTLPGSILCLTFTESGAVNMRKRLAGLIGNAAYHVAIHTFHSFGTEVIGQNREYFYQGAEFNPADEIVKMEVLHDIFENLRFDNPLKSKHPEQGYVYLEGVKSRITDLKKGGLKPEEFKDILEANKIFLEMTGPILSSFFGERISKAIIDKMPGLVAQIAEMPVKNAVRSDIFPSLREVVLESFRPLLTADSTKPFTEWKKKYLVKDKDGVNILKDQKNLEKFFALSEIYQSYQEELHKRGYFDFDDMLLDTASALEMHADFRLALQEKYLYILVDEFQDTNGVQMRLLDNLLNMELSGGRPNILAVGDDDQAIFKFQGANLENILGFHKKFRDPTFITLIHNYRSTQAILDLARKVILQGEDRLEMHMPDVAKTLISSNSTLPEGYIKEQNFQTILHELIWVAEEIKRKIEIEKVNPSEIAVIARKHGNLKDIVRILELYKIPISYERKQNVFDQPHIQQLICMIRYIDSLMKVGDAPADEYLPQILSYDFWQIDELTIWELSRKAHDERKPWISIMLASENQKLQDIAKFFIKLKKDSASETAETIIDCLLGVAESPEDEDGEIDENPKEVCEPLENNNFSSPYKEYYFNERKFETAREEYLTFLSNLQTFINKIRSHRKKEVLSITDIVAFVDLHQQYRIPVTDTSPFNTSTHAVQLLTAHKAKGLEFDTVFVISCIEECWIEKARGQTVGLPSNLPLIPESDTVDDKLRLFFVAITRAKCNLYLTYHDFALNGKETMKLRFIQDTHEEKGKREKLGEEQMSLMLQGAMANLDIDKKKVLETWFFMQSAKPLENDKMELLRNVLKDYKMSVTHLNNFLDVTHAGPQVFLEQNLLQFPKSKNKSASYGTAMHAAIQNFYQEFKRTRILPPLSLLLKEFENCLKNQRLNEKNYKEMLEKGISMLEVYYENRKNFFDWKDLLEVNFASQGVKIGDAEITGKIDKMHIDEATHQIGVYDFKTGKCFFDWNTRGNPFDEVKLWKYRQQLLFYKVLVENSSRFAKNYRVDHGYLEFLECDHKKRIALLEWSISDEEVEKMKKLIQVVYEKIMNLDFPDVSGYEKNMKGITKFMEDLLG
ncbi:MAG: UvrD-helicase domain-containing protein [Candidatus Gracilibacteria bacterium]